MTQDQAAPDQSGSIPERSDSAQSGPVGAGPAAAAGEAAGGAPGKARREVMIVLPGLLLALVIAMLDQLVVSTALPRIVGDLGGLNHLSWVVTAYVLASTITTPLYGKLGDLYGRKRLLMTAIIIFLIGSALSGLSHSMDQLIAFRALQGLGAGGLMVGAIATIGDLVSPRERGQYMGYMMGAMTLAMIAGPLVGGYITDALSWQWIFYINIPIGGAALVYLARTMHLPRKRVEHRVDYLGVAVLAVAATAIVLLTTWGGNQYAWGSPQILGLGAIGLAATAAFIAVEARAAEPVIPLHVFRNRNFSLATVMSFLLGLAMFGAMTFLPLYQQTVQHASATGSGLLLIPLMLGSTVTTLVAGQVTTRTGRYKALPVIGGAVMTVGLILLSRLGPDTSKLTAGAYFVVLGAGMGFLMQITSLIVQNSVHPRDMGVASSSRMFFQQIGGSIGVSLFGVIFTRRLTEAMSVRAPGVHLGAGGAQLDPATVNTLPPAVRSAAFFSISHAVDSIFIWAAPAAAAVFVLAVLIKEVPLRGRSEPPGETVPQPEPELVS
ncbi:MAG TPA: MDR family MFS transporter [Streptosporangiaceae bacterium]|nr:MDR family MFS transporter [Streptosporangiaceae bacterium]